ncbi:MAG: hypothetical protein NTZ17_00795 [Phycisphaerae bacterium]|nr:hypothetical protein [Phycisphaerae bacterium]
MKPESKRATAAAVAQSKSPITFYQRVSQQASAINETLARLLFGLQSPHTTPPERQTVLSTIDDLIRLKIDAGLLKEVHHAE